MNAHAARPLIWTVPFAVLAACSHFPIAALAYQVLGWAFLAAMAAVIGFTVLAASAMTKGFFPDSPQAIVAQLQWSIVFAVHVVCVTLGAIHGGWWGLAIAYPVVAFAHRWVLHLFHRLGVTIHEANLPPDSEPSFDLAVGEVV